jgi:hypothetical protein
LGGLEMCLEMAAQIPIKATINLLGHFKQEFSEIQFKILYTNTTLNFKKVNILIADLFWLLMGH